MRDQRFPGESSLSLLVEGAAPWGDTRINRRLDARWVGVARRLLEKLTPSAWGYLFLTGVSADGETFTINGRVYELDPAGVAAVGDVAITVANGATAAVTAAAIVAQLNADTSRTVDAVLLEAGGVNSVIAFVPTDAVGDTAGDGNTEGFALVETFGNGDWRANRNAADNLDGNGNPAAFREASGSHQVTAQDVANLADGAGIAMGATPWEDVPVRVQYTCMTGPPTQLGSAVKTLATVELRWVQANSGRWILECVDPGAVLGAGDFVHWYVAT